MADDKETQAEQGNSARSYKFFSQKLEGFIQLAVNKRAPSLASLVVEFPDYPLGKDLESAESFTSYVKVTEAISKLASSFGVKEKFLEKGEFLGEAGTLNKRITIGGDKNYYIKGHLSKEGNSPIRGLLDVLEKNEYMTEAQKKEAQAELGLGFREKEERRGSSPAR